MVAACSEGGPPLARAEGEQPQEALVALCEALAEVSRDPAAAAAIFYDRAHARLHDLARAVAKADRVGAARLLEAKQAVESDLDGATPRRALDKDLDMLIAATRRALEVTSGAAPRCSGGADDA
jgi:hypothetical protein